MRRAPLIEAAGSAVFVTVVVTIGTMFVPKDHSGTFVGLVFLAAVWGLVWRRADDEVKRCGVSLGGLMLGAPIAFRPLMGQALRAMGWALAFAAVSFPMFYFGWRWWWKPGEHFSIALQPWETANLVLGQVVLVALPEEAFYRGYLQTRFDDAFEAKLNLFGARVGPGLLIASAIFAIGHVLTIHAPARLAVFFPSLVFGWMRARTGGVGASIAFHVMCNLFTEMLGRGYGLY